MSEPATRLEPSCASSSPCSVTPIMDIMSHQVDMTAPRSPRAPSTHQPKRHDVLGVTASIALRNWAIRGDSALRLAGRSEPVLVWRASRAAGAGPPITRRACPQRRGHAMRVRAVIASAASAALALVGLAAPASAIASPYDTVTVSSMNNLVTAMESYALFDGNDLYLSLIHISEPTRRTPISYAVFCLKKKK